MPRLLKIMIPYAVAVLAAVAIFAAGAYTAVWFTGRVLTPQFGLKEVAELATNHALLHSLDAGNADEARSLLIMEEDGHLISLDMLAPYLPDDLTKSACRIMQKVAKQRADNAAKYSATESASDPGVRQMVAAALAKPAACEHAK